MDRLSGGRTACRLGRHPRAEPPLRSPWRRSPGGTLRQSREPSPPLDVEESEACDQQSCRQPADQRGTRIDWGAWRRLHAALGARVVELAEQQQPEEHAERGDEDHATGHHSDDHGDQDARFRCRAFAGYARSRAPGAPPASIQDASSAVRPLGLV